MPTDKALSSIRIIGALSVAGVRQSACIFFRSIAFTLPTTKEPFSIYILLFSFCGCRKPLGVSTPVTASLTVLPTNDRVLHLEVPDRM